MLIVLPLKSSPDELDVLALDPRPLPGGPVDAELVPPTPPVEVVVVIPADEMLELPLVLIAASITSLLCSRAASKAPCRAYRWTVRSVSVAHCSRVVSRLMAAVVHSNGAGHRHAGSFVCIYSKPA